MSYILRKAVLDTVPEIKITETEFVDLRAARMVLSDAFAIEEKYEIVVTNYLDLEKQLLEVAVTNTVRDIHSYEESFEIRSALLSI